MPRMQGQKEYISLAKGLITEQSALAFPEGATADELNFNINKDGLVRERRKGFEFSTPIFNSAGLNVELENTHYWQAPDLILFIITKQSPQQTVLRIHSNDSSLTFKGEVVLNNAISQTTIAENTNYISITTSEADRPVFVEYDKTEETLIVSRVDLFVRDFELVDDDLSISERPVTLTDNHKYNLYNAGWWKERSYDRVYQDPVTGFFTENIGEPQGVYPSNADIVAIGMTLDGDGDSIIFKPEDVKDIDVGNTEAPRGHYVFNINDFNRDDRLVDREEDGTVSNTLTTITSISL